MQLRQEEAKFRFQLEELSALGQATTGVKLNEDDKKTVEDLGLPAWDPDVEYAAVADQVVPVEGYLCKVCKVFVLSKETAELHARSVGAIQSLCSLLLRFDDKMFVVRCWTARCFYLPPRCCNLLPFFFIEIE